MSKIFVSNWIILDGIFSGPEGETDWFTFDKELEDYNLNTLLPAGTILFGRKTFDIMVNFWPTPLAEKEDPRTVQYMNESAKHIFSKTVTKSDWNNSFFHKELNNDTIEKIKADAPGDIVVLGSGEISMQLHRMGFIDQYNILLDPQLGIEGRQFFTNVPKTSLELVQAKTFKCGVVFLQYNMVK